MYAKTFFSWLKTQQGSSCIELRLGWSSFLLDLPRPHPMSQNAHSLPHFFTFPSVGNEFPNSTVASFPTERRSKNKPSEKHFSFLHIRHKSRKSLESAFKTLQKSNRFDRGEEEQSTSDGRLAFLSCLGMKRSDVAFPLSKKMSLGIWRRVSLISANKRRWLTLEACSAKSEEEKVGQKNAENKETKKETERIETIDRYNKDYR